MGLGQPSFALAVRCHQAGQAAQAVAIYRDILRENPDHPGHDSPGRRLVDIFEAPASVWGLE